MISGFFAVEDTYAPFLIPFKYLSLFKWAFQIFIYNEFLDPKPLTCSNFPDKCDLLKDLGFNETINTAYAVSAAVGIFFSILAFTILYFFVKIKL